MPHSRQAAWKTTKQFIHEVKEEARKMLKMPPVSEEDLDRAAEQLMKVTPMDLALYLKIQDEFCVKCGECCRRCDPILVGKEEVKRIAAYLGTSYKRLKRKLRLAPAERKGFFHMPGRPCPFLRGNLCSIYPVRPEVCRLFPFGEPFEDAAEGRRNLVIPSYCPAVKRIMVYRLTGLTIYAYLERKYPDMFRRLLEERRRLMEEWLGPDELKRARETGRLTPALAHKILAFVDRLAGGR